MKIYNDILENGTESDYLMFYGGRWKLNNNMIMGDLEVGLSAGRKASAELYVKLLKDGIFKKINTQKQAETPEKVLA